MTKKILNHRKQDLRPRKPVEVGLAQLKKLPDEKLAWLLAELKRLEEELKYTVH